MASDGFCPKCGALMYNGACVSCGYGKSKNQADSAGQFRSYADMGGSQFSNQADSGTGGCFSGKADTYTSSAGQGAADRTSTSSKNGALKIGIILVVIICVTILPILIFVGIFLGHVNNMVNGFSTIVEVVPEPEVSYGYNGDGPINDWESWYDQWENGEFEDDYHYDYEEDYTYDEYVPNPSDEYLETIVSSTVRGLSYDIAWNDTYLYADDEENAGAFYCYYPFIIGSDADYVAEINAEISQMAMSYMPTTLSEDDHGYVDGYVTYMSEEVLSVVILYYYEHAGQEEYHIDTLNYDMTTGEQIPIEEILPAFNFIMKFRKSCEEQNGYYSSAVLEPMTDDEIMKAITNPETGAVFYSPVGIDVGFNFEGGWMTVTLKQEYY